MQFVSAENALGSEVKEPQNVLLVVAAQASSKPLQDFSHPGLQACFKDTAGVGAGIRTLC